MIIFFLMLIIFVPREEPENKKITISDFYAE